MRGGTYMRGLIRGVTQVLQKRWAYLLIGRETRYFCFKKKQVAAFYQMGQLTPKISQFLVLAPGLTTKNFALVIKKGGFCFLKGCLTSKRGCSPSRQGVYFPPK